MSEDAVQAWPQEDGADPFGKGWLTDHLDKVVTDLASRPDAERPRLTGERAETMNGPYWLVPSKGADPGITWDPLPDHPLWGYGAAQRSARPQATPEAQEVERLREAVATLRDGHRLDTIRLADERDAALARAEAAEGEVERLRGMVESALDDLDANTPTGAWHTLTRALLDTDSEGRASVVPLATERAIRAESWDEGYRRACSDHSTWCKRTDGEHGQRHVNPYRDGLDSGGRA